MEYMQHEIRINWYDDSGTLIFENNILVFQTLEEPWLLLEEIMTLMAWRNHHFSGSFLVIFETEKSRLFTSEMIHNRFELQAFRVRATAYTREP
jgi:hypothetical protein